jgi:cell division septation protein DedD
LELINKSAYELKDLQYFISSGITLEHGKGMQIDIEINPGGEGIIQEINAQEKIIIPKDTGGILIPDAVPDVPGGPRVLKICFDDMDEHTLMFRENPSDNRFYLMFREDPRYGEFTEYGNETYKVSFSGAIPYVYIKLDARTDDRPRTRELRGRYLSSRETGTEAPAETPTEEPPTPASVPSASQTPVAPAASRTPPRAPPVTPAPAASPTPTTSATTNTEPEGDDSEDEGLNLDELLGL